MDRDLGCSLPTATGARACGSTPRAATYGCASKDRAAAMHQAAARAAAMSTHWCNRGAREWNSPTCSRERQHMPTNPGEGFRWHGGTALRNVSGIHDNTQCRRLNELGDHYIFTHPPAGAAL